MNVVLPCAVYTRKSSEDGLEQGFNSLDAQREACEAFILSQKAQGWKAEGPSYDDGGFSGGNTERPALRRLLADIAAKRVRIVVVYKVDRLTRSLADFAKLVELFDAHGVSFVSVTQQFNTTSSMGRLTLNVLLSFAQFEREVTGERIRDKIAASKRKGLWMGGTPPIGYVPHERTLVIDEPQGIRVREIFRLYLEIGCVRQLKVEIDRLGWITQVRQSRRANISGGKPFSRGHLYRILGNPIYNGQIAHKGTIFAGQHPAIVDVQVWQAVQDRLANNLQGHRTRSTAVNPSLLTGLLFDDQGNRLTPTHAKKGARRYRYYVGRQLHVIGREATPDGLRWPAHELEDAVLRAIAGFLTDESRLIGLMGIVDADEARRQLKNAASLAKQLSSEKSADRTGILKRLVARITVHPNRLEIAIRIGAIWSSIDVPNADAVPALIEVPVTLKRCGMAVRLIVRSPVETARRGPDPKMVALLAKAHDWFARLTSGRCDSVNTIAQDENVTSSYVTRVIYLAFLDPGIVQRILRGDHPLELNSKRLMRMLPLPLAWEEQRTLLGLSS
jgi:DNA invertase Pin-like site-specific DNA recombinase